MAAAGLTGGTVLAAAMGNFVWNPLLGIASANTWTVSRLRNRLGGRGVAFGCAAAGGVYVAPAGEWLPM